DFHVTGVQTCALPIYGVRRIRFTSPHPADFRHDVAQAMAETAAVCEQLHLPLQSGSDRILARMHRGYNRQRFMDRLAMARETIRSEGRRVGHGGGSGG